jgi:hypothetical protein
MVDRPDKKNRIIFSVPKKLRRFIFIGAIFVSASLVAIILAGLYVYKHPQKAALLLAQSIESSTGLVFSTEKLSYSLSPVHLIAHGIKVSPSDGTDGLYLAIDFLEFKARIAGALGHRLLIVEKCQMTGFDGSLKLPNQNLALISALVKPGQSTFLGRIAQYVVRRFLFTEITWSQIEANNGRVTVITDIWQFESAGIGVKATPHNGIELFSQSLTGHSGDKVRLTASGFNLSIDPMDPAAINSMAGRLSIFDGILITPRLVWQNVTVDTQLIYHRDRKEISLSAVKMDSLAKWPHQPSEKPTQQSNLSFAARGNWQIEKQILNLSEWSLDAEPYLTADGRAWIDLSPPHLIKLVLTGSRIKSRDMINLFSDQTGTSPPPLALSGDIVITGRAAGPLNGDLSLWQGDLKLHLKDAPVSIIHSDTHMSSVLSGMIAASGQLINPQFEIDLDADNFTISNSGVSLSDFQPELKANGQYPVLEFRLRTRGKGGQIIAGDTRIDHVRVESNRGQIDMKQKTLSLPHISLSTKTLTNLVATMKSQPDELVIRAKGRNIGLIKTAVAMGILPPDWNIKTEENLDLIVDWQAERGIDLRSKVNFVDFQFSSPEESQMGESVQARIEITSRYVPQTDKIRSQIKLSSEGGEVLWGRYYLDLAANPLTTSGQIDWDLKNQLLTVDRLKTSLKELISLKINGSIDPLTPLSNFDLAIQLAHTSAQQLYRYLISEPYKYDRPSLGEVFIEGRVGGEAFISGNRKNLKVRGRAYMKEGRISLKNSSLVLSGIEFDLPVWYESKKNKKSTLPLKGYLTIADMQLYRFGQQKLHLDFLINPNQLTVPQPTYLNFLSDRILVGPISIRDPYSKQLTLKTGLSFSGIDIGKLFGETWPQAAGGILSGRLESFQLRDNQITTDGQLTIDIFDGRIDIINPGITGLNTSVPVIKFSSQVQELNLEQMTAGTGFGKIGGVLQGTVDNVEIVNNQPQRFTLRLETVKKKGVPQKINIQAVDNIARLGGGGSPFMGMAGSFAKIFREFPYEKIGIASTLENDIFRVNGTIKENGTEYLVKKGGFSGVNVVNLNPDNRISFKDMVKRIKRISGSKDGPVIR